MERQERVEAEFMRRCFASADDEDDEDDELVSAAQAALAKPDDEFAKSA